MMVLKSPHTHTHCPDRIIGTQCVVRTEANLLNIQTEICVSDGHFSDLNYEDPVFHEFNSAFLHTIRFTSWLCVMLRIPMVIGNHYGYRKPEKVIEYQIVWVHYSCLPSFC